MKQTKKYTKLYRQKIETKASVAVPFMSRWKICFLEYLTPEENSCGKAYQLFARQGQGAGENIPIQLPTQTYGIWLLFCRNMNAHSYITEAY